MARTPNLEDDLDSVLDRALRGEGDITDEQLRARLSQAFPALKPPAGRASAAPPATPPASPARPTPAPAPAEATGPIDAPTPLPPGVSGPSLVEVLPLGIILSDASGLVRSANAMARRLFGAEGKALEGRRVIELFETVERSQLAGLLEDAFRARPTREVSLNAVNPAGAVAVRVSAAGRFGADRKLVQVVWTVREAGVNPAALEVHVHSGKQEAIAELGVELGREVNPLLVRLTEALVSVQRVLSSGGDETPDEREAIRVKIADALSGLLRLSEVVTELERFAATAPLKLEAVDPSEVLERSQKLLGRVLKGAKVRVRNDMEEPAPRVLADAPRMTEIFVNLLRNARKAIVRRFDEGDPDASVGTKRLVVVEAFVKDPYVALVLTNNGLPVPAADQEKIFLPSFQARDPEKNGLGLPETAALLKQMGGAIRCESLGDKGTRFILTLPKAP
ncbi:MAG: PAS domain-containing protein [Holophagales bacterium]|nr:PAS domain-containing protein [Holophagales bacterium]